MLKNWNFVSIDRTFDKKFGIFVENFEIFVENFEIFVEKFKTFYWKNVRKPKNISPKINNWLKRRNIYIKHSKNLWKFELLEKIC